MNVYDVLMAPVSPLKQNGKQSSINFGVFLRNSIQKVNELQLESQRQDTLLALGEIDNIHEVMIASQKAEIALQFTLEIKNKVIEAYKEIMRMQI